MRIKTVVIVVIFLLNNLLVFSQIEKKTEDYSIRNNQTLRMDIYANSTKETNRPCLLFVFGGGFKTGTRDNKIYTDYFNYFAKKGFVVLSIDYRLGMKNRKSPSPLNFKPMKRSIEMAVEDIYTATNYALKNANRLRIDTTQFIISGSSAGAVSVLESEYYRRSENKADTILSKNFQYAGVISFSGAIFSMDWGLKYKSQPAPTLLFHGSVDKLVPYNKIKFLHLGMYGSKAIAKQYKKKKFAYLFYNIINNGHEVAEYPMKECLPTIDRFITEYIFKKRPLQVDLTLYDPQRQPTFTLSTKEYYDGK